MTNVPTIIIVVAHLEIYAVKSVIIIEQK